MAGDWVKDARVLLESGGIPTFDMPEQAARAVLAMVKQARFQSKLAENEPRGGVAL
jgi:acetyltransferase